MQHFKNLSLEPITEEIDGVIYVEEWRVIKGYEGIYEISSFGRVKKLSHTLKCGKTREDKILVPSTGKKKQYLKICLRKNGQFKSFSIHRLVGFAYIPLVDGKNHINHTHGLKQHNHYSKLEWCTPQENNEHGVATGLLKRGRNIKPYIKKGYGSRRKKVINIQTNEIFPSIHAVVELMKYKKHYFGKQLRGDRINRTPFRYIGQEDLIKKPVPIKIKPMSPIAVFDSEWNLLNKFSYKYEAAKFVVSGVDRINAFLKGKESIVKGFKFKEISESGEYIDPKPFVSKKKPLKPKRVKQPTSQPKIIFGYDLTGNLMRTYKSMGDAARQLGSTTGYLRRVINGRRGGRQGYYKGFIYKYA